jgi:hypothetical protein
VTRAVSQRGRLDYHRLTPEVTMVVVTFVLVFAVGAQLRVDTDVWWHLRAGEHTLDNGIIRSDPFSFTKAGEDWIDHSWGAEIVSYALWRAGGYGALELLTGLLALAGAALVYRMSSGGTYLRCVATGLAAVTASIFWAPRPQMFSFALSALVLYVLFLRRHRDRDLLWTLPLIMLVWANLHAGFVIGLFLIAGTLAGEALERRVPLDERGTLDSPALRKLAIVGLLSVAAVCVNPYGPRLLMVPLEIGGGAVTRLIEEWMPPDLRTASFWPFAAMLVLLLVSVGASPKRLGWSDAILCSAVTLLAIAAARNIATFAVVAAPVLTYHLTALGQERGWELRKLQRSSAPLAILNVALILVALAFSAQSLSESVRDSSRLAAERETLPVDAVRYLEENGTRDRLFNAYEWGGYVMHELPDVPVFIDGRSDLYGDFITNPYRITAEGSPGWERELDRYGIGTVLVYRTSGLANALAASPAWRWAYGDDLAVVFVRR